MGEGAKTKMDNKNVEQKKKEKKVKLKTKVGWTVFGIILTLGILGYVIATYTYLEISNDPMVVSADIVDNSKTWDGEKVSIPSVQRITEVVYQLESSSGVNEPYQCTSQGKTNGYGYGVYGNNCLCFDTHDEVTEIVEGWFKSCLDETGDLNTCLCRYNKGVDTDQCGYVNKFNSII